MRGPAHPFLCHHSSPLLLCTSVCSRLKSRSPSLLHTPFLCQFSVQISLSLLHQFLFLSIPLSLLFFLCQSSPWILLSIFSFCVILQPRSATGLPYSTSTSVSVFTLDTFCPNIPFSVSIQPKFPSPLHILFSISLQPRSASLLHILFHSAEIGYSPTHLFVNVHHFLFFIPFLSVCIPNPIFSP